MKGLLLLAYPPPPPPVVDRAVVSIASSEPTRRREVIPTSEPSTTFIVISRSGAGRAKIFDLRTLEEGLYPVPRPPSHLSRMNERPHPPLARDRNWRTDQWQAEATTAGTREGQGEALICGPASRWGRQANNMPMQQCRKNDNGALLAILHD